MQVKCFRLPEARPYLLPEAISAGEPGVKGLPFGLVPCSGRKRAE